MRQVMSLFVSCIKEKQCIAWDQGIQIVEACEFLDGRWAGENNNQDRSADANREITDNKTVFPLPAVKYNDEE